MNECMYVCIYICIFIFIYTYIYTNVYIHTLPQAKPWTLPQVGGTGTNPLPTYYQESRALLTDWS